MKSVAPLSGRMWANLVISGSDGDIWVRKLVRAGPQESRGSFQLGYRGSAEYVCECVCVHVYLYVYTHTLTGGLPLGQWE